MKKNHNDCIFFKQYYTFSIGFKRFEPVEDGCCSLNKHNCCESCQFYRKNIETEKEKAICIELEQQISNLQKEAERLYLCLVQIYKKD